MKLELFTGKTQFMTTNAYPPAYYFMVLIGNIIGCLIMAILSSVSIRMRAVPIAISKAEQLPIEALLKGIGCGMLMTIATHKSVPLAVSVMCVAAFILAGFNHCVADAFYLLVTKRFTFIWFATLAGNILGGAMMGVFPASIITNQTDL